jgi:hypothetical protein
MAAKRKTKQMRWLQSRISQLSALAKTGGQEFRQEWNQHLEWIACVVRRQAVRMSGATTASTVEVAIETLRRLNVTVTKKESVESERDLRAIATHCVARAVGKPINRLTVQYQIGSPKSHANAADKEGHSHD